jgi:hypothetical protein
MDGTAAADAELETIAPAAATDFRNERRFMDRL